MRGSGVVCVVAFFATTALAAFQTEPPAGKAPYDRVCRVCHGAEGRGDAAPRLVPFDMDFGELIAKVREGGGQMPPISEQTVSDDEVKQIVVYLKSLEER